jgi:hypothetical protein
MNKQQVNAVSLSMQQLAQEVDDFLAARAGERVAFVIVASVGGVSQYVSNAARADGVDMIEHLLARWEAGRADIPAHYNPDLKGSQP